MAALAAAACALPRKALWDVARIMGAAMDSLPGARSNVILDRNRRNILLPNGLDVQGRDVYRFVIFGILDFLHLSLRPDAAFRQVVEVRGAENMSRAMSHRRGAIAVTGHYGAWELIPRAVSLLGHRTGVLGRKLSGTAADRLLWKLRERPGVLVLDRGSGASGIVRALHGNTAVGILIDQDTTAVESGFVDFFGTPALTPTGPARLAVRLRVPVVPLYARMLPDGRHRVVIEPMTSPEEYAGADSALELTAFLTRRIESWIRDDPRQWVWFHERWCRRPPGCPGLR